MTQRLPASFTGPFAEQAPRHVETGPNGQPPRLVHVLLEKGPPIRTEESGTAYHVHSYAVFELRGRTDTDELLYEYLEQHEDHY